MSKPLVAMIEPSAAVIAYIADRFAELMVDADVGVTLPEAWTRTDTPFVAVSNDGAALVQYPVRSRHTVRLTAWHETTSGAKYLASVAQGVALAHPGGAGVANVLPGSGVFPTTDPHTGADLASCTVLVSMRGVVLAT